MRLDKIITVIFNNCKQLECLVYKMQCVIRLATCTLYKVAVVKGLQRVKCIPSLVDDSNTFAIGYVIL